MLFEYLLAVHHNHRYMQKEKTTKHQKEYAGVQKQELPLQRTHQKKELIMVFFSPEDSFTNTAEESATQGPRLPESAMNKEAK